MNGCDRFTTKAAALELKPSGSFIGWPEDVTRTWTPIAPRYFWSAGWGWWRVVCPGHYPEITGQVTGFQNVLYIFFYVNVCLVGDAKVHSVSLAQVTIANVNTCFLNFSVFSTKDSGKAWKAPCPLLRDTGEKRRSKTWRPKTFSNQNRTQLVWLGFVGSALVLYLTAFPRFEDLLNEM